VRFVRRADETRWQYTAQFERCGSPSVPLL
jgi:hypothetical protein